MLQKSSTWSARLSRTSYQLVRFLPILRYFIILYGKNLKVMKCKELKLYTTREQETREVPRGRGAG
jgi:hypothetical protein